MDFRIETHGHDTVLVALTDVGREFQAKLTHDGTTYVNQNGIVIHYPKVITAAIREAGLTVEQR